ncbi:hypothetical protein TNIN_121891 [Trichonephila inaurata madagascariensis]|uniref:Uncharacterized protein n=1 Tax=Trichonephila inaurata madagascariensis TaxID=2747483 RepID=A0A8X7BNR5_9ARAC|nr:hypothetical protein TNIN_121891 [Trichonephila inaurata madagascariensis]
MESRDYFAIDQESEHGKNRKGGTISEERKLPRQPQPFSRVAFYCRRWNNSVPIHHRRFDIEQGRRRPRKSFRDWCSMTPGALVKSPSVRLGGVSGSISPLLS